MSTSTRHSSFFLILALITCCSVLLAGCGQAILSQPDSGSGEEGAFDEIDLSGSSGDAEGGGDAEDNSGEEEANLNDVNQTIMLTCPSEPMRFNLVLNHKWDFSPGRQTDKMLINGSTAAYVSCPLAIEGAKVTLPQCWFPVTNEGTLTTDAGPCSINATGGGYLEMVRGKCEDGVVTITVLETVDADVGLTGETDCPKVSQPAFAYYPMSQNTLTFNISDSMSTYRLVDKFDISGAYKYTKEWSLYSPEFSIDDSGE